MKNTMKLLGIVALVAVIGFGMIACSNGSTDGGGGTKFEGKWLNLDAIEYFGYTDDSYTFTDNNFSYNRAGPTNGSMTGTFTFTDTTISFVIVSGGSGSWTQNYTLEGNVLHLDAQGNAPMGPYTKQ